MAIVMISSMYQGGREELAQALKRKTDWPVLSREELVDEARKLGIKIGRLEVAMIKRPGLPEKLAREKELYLAFLTATLCAKARQGALIYHGRAGHLLLPGISHRLRVGLTAPREVRIKRTVRALNLTPDKAENYLAQLDEDVAKWIRYIHRADGRDPNHFDLFFNLENMGLSNAAGILCATAELPDFQPTPASLKLLDDLHLSSQAKLRLALDERTHAADFHVKADNGVLTVTYPPDQDPVSRHISQVLADLPGCREIQCTMAETNILWVQERFTPESDNFHQIIRLAQRWGAAVELLRLIPPGELQGDMAALGPDPDHGFGRQACAAAWDGGVEDDDPATGADDGGLSRTEEELINRGRYGGRHTVCGGYDQILERVQGNGRYTLVVIGDMFLAKGHSTRTRQTRELALNIRDRLKAPVITADELKSRFLFGQRQALTLAGFLALVILLYGLVFTHQKPVLDFLGGAIHQHFKWLAAAAVAVFSPLVAYIYGTVAGLALKIINVD
ncbi:MAG: cytidylate kinase family protein [Desulfobacterales bacterium]|nr:MAG: cytidylate kinase family protein [Desulfobacterales bacterium]